MSVENLSPVANAGQDSISDMVQVKLRKNAVLAGLFTDVSMFASPGDKSISFPRWANKFVVQKLSGSQKGDDQEVLMDLDKLELSEEAHIQWAIKKFDTLRTKVPVLQAAIDEATVQHAIGLDEDIYTALASNVFASNQLAGPITQDKIVDMIVQANTIRMPQMGRAFAFGNGAYGTLLKIDGFVDASKSNLNIVLNGQIGVLYGIPVVQSDVLGLNEGFLAHSKAIAYGFGAQPELEDQAIIEYGTGSRRWVMDQMYGVKSLNEGKLAVSIGL